MMSDLKEESDKKTRCTKPNTMRLLSGILLALC